MKKIFIKQIRSQIGRLPKHIATMRGLGLRYIGHVVEREDSSSIQGMLRKVFYMVSIKKGNSSCI